MLYIETADGFRKWRGEPIDGVRHPPNIELLWSAEELAAVGLYAPARPAVPDGKRVASETVDRVDGEVRYVYVLEDIPLEFPPLEPWQFWAVLDLPGSLGASNLRAAVERLTDPVFRAIARAKLNNPPGGAFRRSDPLFSDAALMAAMGVNSAAIDAIWLQADALAA